MELIKHTHIYIHIIYIVYSIYIYLSTVADFELGTREEQFQVGGALRMPLGCQQLPNTAGGSWLQSPPR